MSCYLYLMLVYKSGIIVRLLLPHTKTYFRVQIDFGIFSRQKWSKGNKKIPEQIFTFDVK